MSALTRPLTLRQIAAVLGAISALCGVPPVVAGAVRGDSPWFFDLLSPYALHGAIAALVGAALLLGSGARRRAGVALAWAALAGAHWGAPLWRGEAAARVPGAPSWVLLHLNVNVENGDGPALRALIASSGADVVSLVELSPAMARELAQLPPPWRALATRPARDSFGIGLYTRLTATATRVRQLDEVFPTLEAQLPLGDRRVVLWAVHTLPPIGAEAGAASRRQLTQLAGWVRDVRAPRVVVGDFNATPWSAGLRPLDGSGVARGLHGYFGTWPAPLGALGIPIDHVYTSTDVAVVAAEVVDIPGSDHRGLRVELAPAR